MKKWMVVAALNLGGLAFLAGCNTGVEMNIIEPGSSSTTADAGGMGPGADSEVKEALAALSPEDRAAAEAQKYCAVANSSLLGSMGTPIKLELNGESVFLCCAGCKGKATRDPEGTLANVAKLKAANGASSSGGATDSK